MKRVRRHLKIISVLSCLIVGGVISTLAQHMLHTDSWWLQVYGTGFFILVSGWGYLFDTISKLKRSKKPQVSPEQELAEHLWELREQHNLDSILAEGLMCKCGHLKSKHCIAPSGFPVQLQAMLSHCHADGEKGEIEYLNDARECPCPAFLLVEQDAKS